MIFLATLVGGPLIGYAMYGSLRGALVGLVAGGSIGLVFQAIAFFLTLRLAPTRGKPLVTALVVLPALVLTALILMPPPAADLFQGVFQMDAPDGVRDMRAASDFAAPLQGYYFRFDAPPEAIEQVIGGLELIPAAPLTREPAGAPGWWLPPPADEARTFTRLEADHSIEMWRAGERVWLLARYERR